MPIPGVCAVCGRSSYTLMVCTYCGARVCINCRDPRSGGCKACQGRIMRK